MIYGIEVNDVTRAICPWWNTVPFLKNKKELSFGPGMTILFGPNGSGKSTILLTLAKTLCAWQGGVSLLSESSVQGYRLSASKRGPGEPRLLDGVVPVCDGQGVLYVDPAKAPGAFGGGALDEDFMMQQVGDQFATRGLSAGQTTGARMRNVFAALTDPSTIPLPQMDIPKHWNDLWEEDAKAIKKIVRGTKRTKGPPTLLLDEPDRSLSIPYQANLWNNIAFELEKDREKGSERLQILASTHSPFALDLPGVTYLEMEPGYIDRCRLTYKQVNPRIKDPSLTTDSKKGKN